MHGESTFFQFPQRSVSWVRDDGWPLTPARRKPGESIFTCAVKAPIRAVRWAVRFVSAATEAKALQKLFDDRLEQFVGESHAPTAESDCGLRRCDVRYINLDRRPDRRVEFEREMRSIGVSWHVRVGATVAKSGPLGCSLSHTRVLREWQMLPGRLLLVCEDDAEFVLPRHEVDLLIEEFVSRPELKVLALANRTAWHTPISERLGVSSDIQTTAAYVVKPEIVPQLADIFDTSVHRLAAGTPAHFAALDMVWKELQKKQLFAVPRRRFVVQRAGYSDIQDKAVNYYQ